jgi:hypothetical protein
MSKIIETVEFRDLIRRSHAYKFGKKDWGSLLFRFLMIICRLLDEQPVEKPKRTRRPNAWAVFLGQQVKLGKTIQEAAQLWREQNQKA